MRLVRTGAEGVVLARYEYRNGVSDSALVMVDVTG